MHADQLHIDAALAAALIDAQFPDYRGLPVVRLDGAGTVNAIFRVGEHVTARFPLQPRDPLKAEDALRREASNMDELADNVPVPAPRSLGIGSPGLGYPMPWSLQSWVVGDVATTDGLAASSALAEDVVELIAALRAVDRRGRSFDGVGRGGELKTHDGWMATCFKYSEGLLDVPRLQRLWARLRELPPKSGDVMSHRDLIPANLLVRDDRLVGVLDTGGFGPADPSLDLVAAWHLFDDARRALIRQRLGSGQVEWLRGAAWAFVQAMGLPWYYRITNPAMAALGLSTLARLLADPEVSALP